MADLLPFPEPLSEAERTDARHWSESLDALLLADTLARLVYGARTCELTPAEAAQCRHIGAHALRATRTKWVQAADAHAVERCTELLAHINTGVVRLSPAALARTVTLVVLSAYHDIMEGTIALPPALYELITKDDDA